MFFSIKYGFFKVQLVIEIDSTHLEAEDGELCFMFVSYFRAAHTRRVKANWCNDSLPNFPHLEEYPPSDSMKSVLNCF